MKSLKSAKIKKTISFILILAFLLPFGFLGFPQKVRAVVPVKEEPGPLLETTKSIDAHTTDINKSVRTTEGLTEKIRGDTAVINTYTGATAGFTGNLVKKEYFIDPSFDQIAKIMITALTAMTVQWIQTAGMYPGGGSGSMFIQDINRYFLSVADNAAGRFLEQILAPEIFNLLCTPFRLPLINALRNTLQFPFAYFPRARCTVTDIVNNFTGFLNGGFLYGGYGAWNELIKPQNNFYGSYLLASSELLGRQAAQLAQAQSELSFGQGFLSWKKMEKAGTEMKCKKWSEQYNYGKKDCLMWEEVPIYKEAIKTPGKIIEDELATQFGSSVRSLEIADELNEIIAAIIQRLITEILMGGRGVAGWKTDSSLAWQEIQNITQNYKPDLAIGNVSYSPTSPWIGDAISFNGQLINTGTASTSVAFNVRLRLDVNNNGSFDRENSMTAPSLDMGANRTITWPNFWNAETGTHKFEICADVQNGVEELDETNNCNSLIFIVPNQPPPPPSTNPDLVIDSVSFTPSPAGTGSQTTFMARVRNRGVLSSPVSTARLRIDVNNNGSWDVNASVDTPTVSQTEPRDVSWPDIWTATLGTHRAEVCADTTNVVNEADEQNNCRTITFEVVRMADLIISSIGISPSNPNTQEVITFTAKVKNQGDATSTPSTTRARIDLQNNGSWDITLTPDQATGQLTPGTEETEIWVREIDLTGQHRIEVCADIGNSVVESQEGNNCSSLNFYVSYW